MHKHYRVTRDEEDTARWYLTSCLRFSTESRSNMKMSPPPPVNMKNTPPCTFQLFRPCDTKSVHQLLTVRIHFLTEASTRVNHVNLLQAGRDKGFAQKCVDIW